MRFFCSYYFRGGGRGCGGCLPYLKEFQTNTLECASALTFSNYRNAAAILGTFFVGRLLLQELCGLVSGFRAFVLAPFGIGAANLCKHGRWAGKTVSGQ